MSPAVAIHRSIEPRPAQDRKGMVVACSEDTPAAGTLEAPACEFEIITERTAFDALEHDWNDLFERAGRGTQAFQTFGWSWHWCNHYLAKDSASGPSLAIVTGRCAGRLVMVWPLVATRAGGLRQLSWMGEPVSQYGDVLVDEAAHTLALLRVAWSFIELNIAHDLVRLRKVRDDAMVAPLLAELGARATLRLDAPYLDLASAEDFDSYVQRYSSRSRKKRRASARRLATLGPVTFARHTGGGEARCLALGALAMKRAQLKARALISPTFADPRMTGFFADAAAALGRPAGCSVLALACDGEYAAIDVLVGCKDRVATHIFAYSSKFEKESVGVQLLERAIAQSFADGYRTFDFLAPADEYKMHWADGVVGVTDWAIPTSVKGWVFARFFLALARPALKTALAALPMPLRRFVASRYPG